MTETDLETIEQALAVSLPSSYRSIVLNYPQELLKLAELFKEDDDDEPETPADLELLNDPKKIISENQHVRRPGIRYTESGDPWPADYFVVGIDGCGEYYAIDLRLGDESPVFYWDHESREWSKDAPNIREFVPQLVKQYYENARDDGFID